MEKGEADTCGGQLYREGRTGKEPQVYADSAKTGGFHIIGTTENGKSLSLKELPSLRRKGGEAGKRHEVHFAAGVGFYTFIILPLLSSLSITPACVCGSSARCAPHPQTHRSPRGGRRKGKENAKIGGFNTGNPPEMAALQYPILRVAV